MAIKLRAVLVFAAVMIAFAALLQRSEALNSHEVGGTLGWVVPPGGSVAYTTWAATQSFALGDSLVFNYTTGQHDVAEVTKAAFDGCTKTNPLSLTTTGPTTVTLNSTGELYFICTIATHCSLGQKVAINVSTATSSSPPSSSPSSPPSPTTTPPPPPPPPPPAGSSTPSSLAIAALPITLLSTMVLALFN